EWAASVARSDLYLSAITVMELEMGVRLMERRDVAQGALLRRWITRVVMSSPRSSSTFVYARQPQLPIREHLRST
ncbi:MAG: hypothetical protein OXE40_15710, partial [Gammaproteobacteria bacterium]|nr:hypothetical protein [Gammaproteobacteria bacterium]